MENQVNGTSEQQQAPVMLKILTTEPKQVTSGKSLVSFSRKSTDKNPVAETDKFRAVEVPQYSFSITAVPSEAQSIFAVALEEVFYDAAGKILKEHCDANKAATEVREDLFTFSAVVTKMSDLQTSQRLNGDQIKAWYDASKTKSDATTRYTDSEKGKRQQAQLREKYISLASNNAGIDPTLAQKMLGYINVEDTNSPVCAAIVRKLERLSKTDTADEL